MKTIVRKSTKSALEFAKISETGTERSETSYVSVIRQQHKRMCEIKAKQRFADLQLMQDIAIYEFILNHDDPEKVADAYMRARHESVIPKSKMEVAREMGWEIKI